MALIDVVEGSGEKGKGFKDFVKQEVDTAFFDTDTHAAFLLVDGREMKTILEETDVRQHNTHWEAGAKQNFDTGLYKANLILYLKAEDYGPKPKVGKELVLASREEGWKRTYNILKCEEEDGVYRMTLNRVRQ